MKLCFLDIKVTPKGRLVPIVIGQPNDHLSDWQGCNHRMLTLPGWKRNKTLKNTSNNRVLLKALIESVDKKKVANAVRLYKGAGIGEQFTDFVDLTTADQQIYRQKQFSTR